MWLKPWHTARAYFSPGICIASLYHPITCWKKEGKQWTKIVHRAEKHTSVPPGKEILQVLSIYFLHFWQWKSAWADAKSARIWLHSPCFCYFSWHVLWGGKCQTSLKFVTGDLVCSRLQCLNQPWPMWGNDFLGHFGWLINICSLQRCWWLFFQSVLMGCHKFNLCAVTHRCQFQIKLQALYSYHHQAAPAYAMSTPGTLWLSNARCTMQVLAVTASACATSQQRALINGKFVFSPEVSSGWTQAPEIPAVGRKQASIPGWSHILCCLNWMWFGRSESDFYFLTVFVPWVY